MSAAAKAAKMAVHSVDHWAVHLVVQTERQMVENWAAMKAALKVADSVVRWAVHLVVVLVVCLAPLKAV